MLNPLRCLALILMLLVPCAVRAEVDIPPDCRVKNRPPGRCGWCALETLSRHLRIRAMYGLTDHHPSLCSPHSLEECLKHTHIPYRIQYPGRLSEEILRYAVRADLGAAVGLRGLHPGEEKHIVTLIDFRDDAVKVIDPNDPECRTKQISVERFRRWWDGFALVLEPGSDWTHRNERSGKAARDDRPVYGSFSLLNSQIDCPRLPANRLATLRSSVGGGCHASAKRR